jgi:hypothetical protein
MYTLGDASEMREKSETAGKETSREQRGAQKESKADRNQERMVESKRE